MTDKKKGKGGKKTERRKLDHLEVPVSIQHRDDLVAKLEREEITLTDALEIFAGVVEESMFTPGQVARAFRHAANHIIKFAQGAMVAQAVRYIKNEYRLAEKIGEMIDRMIERFHSDKAEDTMTIKEEIAIIKLIMEWRVHQTEYSFKVLKFTSELEAAENFMQTYRELDEMSSASDSEWEIKLAGMSAEERRDMAVIVNMMLRSQTVNLNMINNYLGDSG